MYFIVRICAFCWDIKDITIRSVIHQISVVKKTLDNDDDDDDIPSTLKAYFSVQFSRRSILLQFSPFHTPCSTK
jgi:hypothetical protein